ncbi:nuclear factor of activated T-cells, cytoplasmic 4 isoform X1 [Bufo gargarizans]|uniref:nuclear factor of activated T-cells, cytoplasmic 4 isoform X1 n=1 Tax=Bufo gargarizans TaxID=30331 RepID=UPI001CF3CB38|nr:nuclear factor of activated T-cells, cytoplasmic 4 isoform X1 [Bufo gargarizans]
MGTAICQDGDLDFRLIFGEEDSDSPSPRSTLHTADLESDDPSLCNDGTTDTLTLNLSNTCVAGGAGSGMGCARAGMHSPPPRRSSDHDINGTFLSQPSRFIPLGGSRFLECPSIRITSDSPSNSDGEQEEQGRRDIWDERPHRDQLFLPPDPFVYRDSFLSPSPASSHSSWSILSSEASSCDSLGQMCEEVERELNEAASRFTLASPLGSPRGSPKPWSVHNDEFWPSGPSVPPASSREELLSPYPQGQISRPTSPCGKRRYSNSNEDSIHHTSSPSPSPSRRGSLGDENLSSEAEASPKPPEHNQQTISNSQERGDNIPQKARRTSAEQTVAPVRPEESSSPAKTFSSGASVCLSDENNMMFPQTRKENAGMDYLAVPSALAWSKARVGGQSPVFRSSSLPPLDWPLPCQYEGLELRIEVQPRTHHRAHYETEGSRGAVKASPGGHPIVKLLGYNEKPLTLQMFIGTADERNLRPHAFYQVHRITGKMVATPSYEALVGSTKVLEMSLLPENNMCANIDCAGILKLRNSDIELRKGETDIGRKNTRVRLVFRVHIPQGGGKGISLQVASIPIECSQRSAQELPQVENYSLSACSVNGREELLLCGSNFLSDSKVVFIEKGPDGKLQWEEEAKVNRLKSNESLLSVQVPEYCNKEITRPLQVYFYISNGRRKRSPMQSFRYLPIIFKEEPLPEMTLHRFPPSSLPPPSHINLDPGHMELSTSFESPVTPNLSEAPMEVSPYYISPHQERMFSGVSDCSAGNSSFLGCYFNPTVLSELKCPPSYPENGGDMSITLPFQTINSALPPSPVPWSPQPRSSHPTSSNTFGSLHPHLNTNNKLEERGTGSHANYQSSPILPSLEFDSTQHFGPGYEPYPSCPPPTYTTLGEVNSLNTMHSKQSTASPEISRTEQSTSNQQFTQSTLSNHSTNPVHPLRSKIDEVGSVSHTGFSTSNSSLSLSCKDNGGSQTFSTDYHNMSSCSPSQLTTLCPSTHPATFSSSPSPTIPSTSDPGHEGTSDTTVCIPSNQNEKDVCYQEHLEEYTKSANSGGGEVRKEHSQVFENPFHPIPIQGITLEEVSEFIGQDLHSFPERHQN